LQQRSPRAQDLHILQDHLLYHLLTIHHPRLCFGREEKRILPAQTRRGTGKIPSGVNLTLTKIFTVSSTLKTTMNGHGDLGIDGSGSLLGGTTCGVVGLAGHNQLRRVQPKAKAKEVANRLVRTKEKGKVESLSEKTDSPEPNGKTKTVATDES
jgi:hypothetical protein